MKKDMPETLPAVQADDTSAGMVERKESNVVDITGLSGLHPASNIRKPVWIGMITIFVLFGGFGLWAAIAPLSSAVIGHGVVKVDLNRKTVQHLEGGIIKEIRVRDGDHVEKGQVLIVIEDERVAASVDVLLGQLDVELAKAARLEAERQRLDTIVFPRELEERRNETEIAELLAREENFFHTRLDTLNDSIRLLQQKKQQIQEEITGLGVQIKANKAGAEFLEEEIAANESLEVSQYVQKTTLLGLKRELENYRTRLGEFQTDLAQARQKITDIDLQIVQLHNDYEERATQELTGANATGVYANIFTLRERLRPSQDAQRRQNIVAPINGVVVNLQVFTVGGVVTPRQPLMDIVPDENPLIIEAEIPVDSVDDVYVGQLADIRFSAYKRRATPLVEGNLTYVSADRITEEHSDKSYYLAHVNIDMQSLADSGIKKVTAGMPAEVFIRTGERTALDYMLSPLTNAMRRSFREP